MPESGHCRCRLDWTLADLVEMLVERVTLVRLELVLTKEAESPELGSLPDQPNIPVKLQKGI